MRLKLDPQDGWLRDIAGIMSCYDSIIDHFSFFSQHVVTRVSSAVPLYHCTIFTPNWSLNDLTLNCLIATSWQRRSLFIATSWQRRSLFVATSWQRRSLFIATSRQRRSLFIKTFYFWIHCSLYWRSYKRKSIGTLFHQ